MVLCFVLKYKHMFIYPLGYWCHLSFESEQGPDPFVKAIFPWEGGAGSLLGLRQEEEKQREQWHRSPWLCISNTTLYQLQGGI